MNVEILKEKDAVLLSRKRVTATTTASGATPSRLAVKKELAKKLKVDPSLVIIKHLYPQFGEHTVKIIANVYSDRKMLEKLEHEKLVAKHADKEEPKEEKAEEAKAEEKPAEAPEAAEEKKEEAPAEEKKESAEEKKEETPAAEEKSE